MAASHLLEVKNLTTEFRIGGSVIRAVDGISYYIDDGEIVGLVGESGCGKSASQLSVLQLIPMPPGNIVSGEAIFQGIDLLDFDPDGEQIRAVRGGKIGLIFQEPMTSLNPVLTIGRQIIETLVLHLHMDRQSARKRAVELIDLMGIPDAKQRIDNYPHQFSGGMRQRIMIAMAVSCNPNLLIADEPTTALDVTTQAQILEILRNMVKAFNTSLLIVTHNLGVVARYAQRIYVMYAGRIVESGTVKDIFDNPCHPYTLGLLKSVPRLDEPKGRKLVPIVGLPPNLGNMPGYCAFWPRCSKRSPACKKKPWPELRLISGQHYTACDYDFDKK
ncbi:MAG: ABC transporter ATP-binding protein [Deltaproteobacteria bacterium]|nr:ABC transporter ATP-binding protein [Deltaproteobacteria bacterium]